MSVLVTGGAGYIGSHMVLALTDAGEDVVVSVSALPEFLDGLAQLSNKYTITNVNFGHAGNGNIHVNLLVNPDMGEEMERAE